MLDSLINIATQPIRDGADVIDGLMDGEIRTDSATRLGADILAGMALSEVVDLITEDDD